MTPPKAENLTSTTISSKRRSYHWGFGKRELDLTISAASIVVIITGDSKYHFRFDDHWCKCNADFRCQTPVEYIEKAWLVKNEHSLEILSWFGDTSEFMEFIKVEYQEIVNPEQRLLDL